MNKIIVRQLNINPIRNKFDFLAQQVKGNIDILMISEKKLDESFPVGQFLIDGYNLPFGFDRNGNGGGILLYIREDIPSIPPSQLNSFLFLNTVYLERIVMHVVEDYFSM